MRSDLPRQGQPALKASRRSRLLAELHRCDPHAAGDPRCSISSEPPRQLDIDGVEVDIADLLKELGGPGLSQRLGQPVLFSRQMGQRHQRLVTAVACCIWLLTVVAPLSGQTEPPHVTELRLAADQGNSDAQFYLGILYDYGSGVPQDHGEAVRWYRLAADQGDTAAQFSLGFMYNFGRGVPQNHGEAVRWYRLAADQGHTGSQFNLSLMYNFGRGVPQDYIAAHMWANLAAAQGDEHARGLRDDLAGRMSSEQIAAAQRAAREWRPVSQIQSR